MNSPQSKKTKVATALRCALSFLLSLLPLSPFLNPAGAAVPLRMTFQGRLSDSANRPRSGSFRLDFRITAGSDGSGPLWSETQSPVQVVNGLFSVQLGAATPLKEEVFDAENAYVELTVTGLDPAMSPELLLPRQKILSSPYSINSARLGGNASSYYVSTGTVNQAIDGVKTFSSFPMKSGSLSPTDPKEFATKSYVDSTTGGGNAAILTSTQSFSGQNTFKQQVSIASHAIVTAGVAIGTLTPGAYKLNVQGGNVNVKGSNQFPVELQGGNAAIPFSSVLLFKKQDGTALWQMGSGAVSGTVQEFGLYDSVAAAWRLNVKADGNVGIGSNAPLQKLDVAGSLRINSYIFSPASFVGFLTDASGALPIKAGSLAITSNYGNSAPANGLYVEGSVGVGTTGVNGKAAIWNSYNSGVDSLRFDFNDGANNYWMGIQPYVVGGGNVGYKFRTNNIATTVEALAISGAGLVGIGTTAPNGRLDIFNPGANGDGVVMAPDLTMDNNFTIQTYIDGNLAGGGFAGRATYAGACCNNLALQPDAGTVSIGGVSGNYGTNKFNVIGNANITGNMTANTIILQKTTPASPVEGQIWLEP